MKELVGKTMTRLKLRVKTSKDIPANGTTGEEAILFSQSFAIDTRPPCSFCTRILDQVGPNLDLILLALPAHESGIMLVLGAPLECVFACERGVKLRVHLQHNVCLTVAEFMSCSISLDQKSIFGFHLTHLHVHLAPQHCPTNFQEFKKNFL